MSVFVSPPLYVRLCLSAMKPIWEMHPTVRVARQRSRTGVTEYRLCIVHYAGPFQRRYVKEHVATRESERERERVRD